MHATQLDRIEQRQTLILHLLVRVLSGERTLMTNLDALTAQVAATATVEASAVALIQGLSAQLAAAGTDPVALAALQAQLNTSATALAAAVAANPIAPPAPAPAT